MHKFKYVVLFASFILQYRLLGGIVVPPITMDNQELYIYKKQAHNNQWFYRHLAPDLCNRL